MFEPLSNYNSAKTGGWQASLGITDTRNYTCGHCGGSANSTINISHTSERVSICFCGYCKRPTYFEDRNGAQIPSRLPGRPVPGLSGDVSTLFQELRSCTQAGAWNAAVVTGRSLLLRLAWTLGADPKQVDNFKNAREYLTSAGHVSQNLALALDQIAFNGNTVIHYPANATAAEALQTVALMTDVLDSTLGTEHRLKQVAPIQRREGGNGQVARSHTSLPLLPLPSALRGQRRLCGGGAGGGNASPTSAIPISALVAPVSRPVHYPFIA